MHGAYRQRVLVGAYVTHHANAPKGKQHTERLPNLTVQAGLLYLRDKNVVSFLKDADAFLRDLTHDPHRKTGARKWLAPDHVFRKAELESNTPNLIFEQLAQWLD